MAMLRLPKIFSTLKHKKKPKSLKEPQTALHTLQTVHTHHPFPQNEFDQHASKPKLKKRKKESRKTQLSDVAGLDRSTLQTEKARKGSESQLGGSPQPEDEQENQKQTQDERIASQPYSSISEKKAKGKKRKQLEAVLDRKSKRKANDGKTHISGDSQLAESVQRIPPIEIVPDQNGPLRGMRKWLADYHSKRPGLRVLQQQIDDCITNFEAQEEKARKEREAAAEEEGWTVVQHHKGRKKTADLDTGVRVGGVAPAAVETNLKAKKKDAVLNFYRFQRRDARRNEVLELQQRFEEDKKKIAALRAARKFRPY